MNAYGIVRKSTANEANIASQRGTVEAFAAGKGAQVATWLEGDGAQGSSERWHAQLRAFVQGAVAAGADLVVVALGLDRLVRDVAVQNEIIDALDAAGIPFYTSSGEVLTNLDADAWERNSYAGIRNEGLSRRTRERVAANKAARLAAGKLVGPLPRIGYRSVPAPDRVGYVAEIVPEHAPVALQVFTMYADGERDAAILEYVNGAGLCDADGEPIVLTATALQAMIRSPIYRGMVPWGGREYDGAHEGIVSDRLWRRANEARRPRGKRPRSDRLLAGLRVLVCAECGRALVVGSGGRTGERIETYTHPSNTACRASGSVSADRAERHVLQHVALAIRDLEGRAAEAVGDLPAELARADERIAKLRRMARLVDDEAGFADEYREAVAVRDRIAADLADRAAVAGATWKVGGSLFDPDFGSMPRDVLRDVIATVMEKVEVRRRKDALHNSPEGRFTFHVRGSFDVGRVLDRAAVVELRATG